MTDVVRKARGRRPRARSADLSTEDRVAELEERLRELEGRPDLRERGRHLVARIVPPEAMKHFRNSGREQLMGIRSIVDHWIRRLDEAEARADRRAHERETIEVE